MVLEESVYCPQHSPFSQEGDTDSFFSCDCLSDS